MDFQASLRLYTIKEVSLKTGLSTQLIRKWEERYEAVVPTRFPNGYRGYTRADVDKLLWLKSRVDQGVPIGLAVVDFNENGFGDQLAEQSAFSSPTEVEDPSEYQKTFLRYFLDLDIESVQRYYDGLISIHPMDYILIHIIHPVLVEIGTLWMNGEASEYQEHFASNFLREKIQALIGFIPPAPERPHLYSACLPHERHEIGLLFFNYFAAKQGYPIIYLGPSPAETGIFDCLRTRKPIGLFFSVSTIEIYKSNEAFLRELDRIIATEKHLTKVFLGGRAIREDRLYPGTQHIFELTGNSEDTISKIRSYIFDSSYNV